MEARGAFSPPLVLSSNFLALTLNGNSTSTPFAGPRSCLCISSLTAITATVPYSTRACSLSLEEILVAAKFAPM